MTPRALPLLAAGLLAVLACSSAASAAPRPAPGVQRLHYRYGPITVKPGTNLILLNRRRVPKPTRDGYITRISPNLRLANGKVPRTDFVHLHHGVWLNVSGTDAVLPGYPQKFFASGEEKTVFSMPTGYGYPVRGSDRWILNYMIHDLTAAAYQVYIDYDIDFIPAGTALAQSTRPVRPIWMDVQNAKAYPVFDVHRGSGGDGRYTYPDEASNPYGGGPALNEWRVDRPGTLVATAGHLHPGGLYDDLDLVRPGTVPAPGTTPGHLPGSVRLFRSQARYFDPHGPVSWDLAMTHTRPNWRVRLQAGDILRLSATYDSKRASWYEAMGIEIAYMSDDTSGADPFAQPVDTTGTVTHGHLAENNFRGGLRRMGVPDPTRLPGRRVRGNVVPIRGFKYLAGGLGQPGAAADPPMVAEGQSLLFRNLDPGSEIFHSVTACRAPCTSTTGISSPLANGAGGFDSGQLGTGPLGFTAAANRVTWSTPANLKPGTYTYYCRVHPFMRGAFRVVRR